MTTKTMRVAVIVLAALALVCGAGMAAAEEISRDYHESFDVGPGARLRLEHGDGDVTISPWERDVLDVEVRYRAEATNVGWTKSTDFEVDFRRDGDVIHVIGREPKRIGVGFSSYREHEYTYRVQAPSYLEVELRGEDGDVEIEGWRSSIEMRLDDGDVLLSDIQTPRAELILEDGELRIHGFQGELTVDCEDGDVEIFDCRSDRGQISAEDGNITLDGCEGSFEISAADGDVRLSRLTPNRVEIRSDDGNVDLQLLSSEAFDVSVRVGDGDVTVDLEEGVSAAFELETRDGRIRVSAAEVKDLSEQKNRVTGRIGAGQGSLYVRSADGRVTLRQ